ncbi:MAG: plasmid maintenance system killer protein [Rubritalea sp.]|jgi:plasmid maintenance system killer protein
MGIDLVRILANIILMIESFSDSLTEKIFNQDDLTRKEIRSLGALNIHKAAERLHLLNKMTEKDLLQTPSLKYHTLNNGRYSIDADSRKSKWRITFQWDDDELVDVSFVKIEDTH